MADFTTRNSLFYGQMAGISGIPLPLSDTSEAKIGIEIMAGSGNTGILFLGDINVAANSGWPLRPSEKIRMYVDKPSAIYVISNQPGGSGISGILNSIFWIGQ